MKLHRRIAGLFGYELIKTRKLNDTLEQLLANLLVLLKIDLVIDVGANTGQFGRLLRNIGYTGRIASFEPLPDPYDALVEASRADSNWYVWNLALGSATDVRYFNEYESADFSSFLEPNSYSAERYRWRVRLRQRHRVSIRSLDSLWSDISGGADNSAVFLKLDTQGYDLEVLRGARAALHHVEVLQSEISTKAIYQCMPSYLSSLAMFDELGFEVCGMYPVSRCKRSLAVIEYDCVLRRREADTITRPELRANSEIPVVNVDQNLTKH